jgi:hypothetical protein
MDERSMIEEPLPGKSLVLYRVFSECTGRWSTPKWIMGVDTRARWVPHGDNPSQSTAKPLKMSSTGDSQ